MSRPYNLRNKVMFRKQVEPTSPAPPLDDYEDYKPIWGEVRFLRGGGLFAAKSANVKTTVEFIVRYREDIDETMRVLYKGKEYLIEGIIPLDSHNGFLSVNAYNIKHDV